MEITTPRDPGATGRPVTKSDTETLRLNGRLPRRLRIGTGGSLIVDCVDGYQLTVPGVLDGENIDMYVVRVRVASTADNITAFY